MKTKYDIWVWTATQAICALLLSFALASSSSAAPAYPLQKSANGRYLVDQNNVPYLIVGDSPQALIVNLSTNDAETYLADRATNGFNTLWINVLCNQYTGGRVDGSTFDGILPFNNMVPSTSSYDLTTPNEAYFARVDQALTLAAQQGLLVMLDPIETGGWLNTILDNGTINCRAYGQYLGNRYKNFNNIIWLNGNDYQTNNWSNPAVDTVVQAVALGIQDNDTRHIQTIELNYQTSGSLDDNSWAPIISLNASYTYFPTYAQVLEDYNRTNFLPTFLVEANYEFENDWFYNSSGRRQEYWSLLSGACGQLYGNHFTWQFLPGWQTDLDTGGSTQMEYVTALFAPLRWYDLVPDQNHTLVTDGYGTFASTGSVNNSDYATAASTTDGVLAIVYMPTTRTITVDLSQLSGPVTAQWYDPSRGIYAPIAGSPFANDGLQDFIPTSTNADGDGDWVLVLDAATPSLTITQPSDFQVFTNSPITVAGTAGDANGVSSVTVNGTAATLAGSNWNSQVTLNLGTNVLTVIATDAPGANGTTNIVHAIFQPPPSAFALISPLDGTANLSLQPVLAWTPSSSDVIYSVQVATTSDFASPVFSQDGLVALSTTVTTGLTDGVTYFWQVIATNPGGTIIATNTPFSLMIISASSAIMSPSNVTVLCASEVPPPDFVSGSVLSNLPVSWTGDLTNDVTCLNRFTIQRTYTATDLASNTASCTQLITIDDTTTPTLTMPANVTTVTDSGQGYASGVVLGNATAVASCSDDATVMNDAPSQFPVGTNTVIWTATDSCSSSIGTQLVIVVDNQPPTITQCAPSLTMSATTNAQAVVPTLTNAVVAADNSTPARSLDITQDPTPGTLVGLGTNTVTITVTDASGNASQCMSSLIVTQTLVQAGIWEVSMVGKSRATCVLKIADDSSVSGYGIEESLCGAFSMAGSWTPETREEISGTVNQSFSATSCQHAASIEGAFTTGPIRTTTVNASGLDSLGRFRWSAVRGPSFPVLISGWQGTLRIKRSQTQEVYNLTPGNLKPGWYDIQGQSVDASYTLTGALIVTSRNLVTAWIVRELPSGPVASFYTGSVNLRRHTLSLTGTDATGARHRISAAPQ
jgi:uncharacterized protein DUF4038/collagenase-like protein with putative collagen-binding domain/glucodextranase-like protein/HYR domain-containing protein